MYDVVVQRLPSKFLILPTVDTTIVKPEALRYASRSSHVGRIRVIRDREKQIHTQCCCTRPPLETHSSTRHKSIIYAAHLNAVYFLSLHVRLRHLRTEIRRKHTLTEVIVRCISVT
jgi:hypothetical protein